MAHALPEPPAPAPDRPELFTQPFWLVTIARVVRGAAVGGTACLGAGAFDSLATVPWQSAATGCIIGAIMSLAASLTNQIIPGDTTATIMRLVPGRR